MLARRLVCLPLLIGVPLLLSTCATMLPDHMTIYTERNATDTTGGNRRNSAVGYKQAVSLTWDLKKR